jgi:hypothetical protein
MRDASEQDQPSEEDAGCHTGKERHGDGQEAGHEQQNSEKG